MAYSLLQKFYINHEQEKVITYLYQRGMPAEEIAGLRWESFKGLVIRSETIALKIDRELASKLRRLAWKNRHLTVPHRYLFYKKTPDKNGEGGQAFAPGEIREICGNPPENPLTKMLTNARLRVSSLFV